MSKPVPAAAPVLKIASATRHRHQHQIQHFYGWYCRWESVRCVSSLKFEKALTVKTQGIFESFSSKGFFVQKPGAAEGPSSSPFISYLAGNHLNYSGEPEANHHSVGFSTNLGKK